MRRVWLRVSFVITMVGVAAAAGYQVLLTEQQIASERAAQRAFRADAWILAVALGELHAAQQSYVAVGQDRDVWLDEVTRRFDALTADLAALTSISVSPRTIGALDEAASALEALKQVDRRVRDQLASALPLLASDLIFDDSLELAREAARHVGRARTSERAVHEAAVLAHREFQGQALAAATGTGVLVALLLLPVGRGPAEATRQDEDVTPAETDGGEEATAPPAGGLLLDLRSAPPPAEEAPAEQPAVAPPPTPGVPAPDLRLAADLCTELGRSSSAKELPPLLARMAQVLNASGIIVWVLDGTGEFLRPALVHGYPAAAMARVGVLPCDGDNITAAAFRDVRMHVLPSGEDSEHGALAAPLTAPEGCGGVISLELNDGWETSESVQSTTAIIAAQLATLVAADTMSRATGVAGA